MRGSWCFTSDNKSCPLASVPLKTSTRASLSVTSSGVLRSACCCFQNSTRTPVRRFPWQLHDSTSDVLYVSTELYFNCSCNLSVFCSWDMMTFHIKSHARSIIFCPSSDTNKIPGRKLIASAKYQTVTTGMFHKALGILPGLFHGWSTTRLFHNKNIRTLSTLLNHCITVLELLILHCR